MIAVGRDHIVELLNRKVAVFARTNAPPLQVAVVNDFFAVTNNGTTYPQGTMILLHSHIRGRPGLQTSGRTRELRVDVEELA